MKTDIAGKNLELLLAARSVEDIHLGLQLAGNQDLEIANMTAVVGLALFHPRPNLRELAAAVLQQHASKALRLHLQDNWQSTDANGDPAAFFAALDRISAWPELDAALLQRLAVRHAGQFPYGMSSRYPWAFLEYCDQIMTADGGLWLAGHMLKELPREFTTWMRQQNLRTLTIANTNIQFFPEFKETLPHLESLQLPHNALQRCPGNMNLLPNLRRLSLAHNQISALPDELASLQKLESFEWQANPVTHFPKSISELPFLKSQHLHITEAGDYQALARCHNLDTLSFKLKGAATVFPEEITQLTRLKHLTLSSPQVPHPFPTDMHQLQALETLELECDPRGEFPAFSRQLSRLKSLTVAGVGPWKSSQFSPQPMLETLALARTTWETWPESFCAFPQLTSLTLSQSKIHDFPPAFAHFTQLRHLSIQKTPIGCFPDLFFAFAELEHLELLHCQVPGLPENFDQFQKLRRLHISGKEFRTLPACLSRMQQLEQVSFVNVRINLQAFQALKAALPNTEIVWR